MLVVGSSSYSLTHVSFLFQEYMDGSASGEDQEDEVADDETDVVHEDTKEDKNNVCTVNTKAADTFDILYPLAHGRFVKSNKVRAKTDMYKDNSLDSTGTSTDSRILLKCKFQDEHTWLQAPLLDAGDTVPYWDDLKVTMKPFDSIRTILALQ